MIRIWPRKFAPEEKPASADSALTVTVSLLLFSAPRIELLQGLSSSGSGCQETIERSEQADISNKRQARCDRTSHRVQQQHRCRRCSSRQAQPHQFHRRVRNRNAGLTGQYEDAVFLAIKQAGGGVMS
ncbi:MAG: hypothetical protein ACI9DC_004079 [Gammaproteobacteria bacterium]|jgi:hypothetical protein